MRSRAAALLVCVLSMAPEPAAPTPPASPAVRLWEHGQKAMLDGDLDAAIADFRGSLRLEPRLARNYLSLSAAALEKGEDSAAAGHMADYLRIQPDHCVVRLHFAELQLRLGRTREAREQFERFVADVQAKPNLAEEHLIHCHSKLMEIASAGEDDYGEHLHRGIGLYLLAKQREALPDPNGDFSAEGMLCKAAGELAQAARNRPDQARPCWYLSAVWTELAQRRQASRWLRAAEAAAPFSYLTPVERDGLRLACRDEESRTRLR